MEKQFPVVYNPAQWDPPGWAGHTHLLSYRVVVVSTSEASVPVGVTGVAPTLQRRFPMVNHVFSEKGKKTNAIIYSVLTKKKK